MHELVHSVFHSKLLSALRLPSFAGEGLPERMRSISFALLGLTAAAGLALVAIFAQPGFTLISPAPLPDRPSAGQAVAEAKKLTLVHRPAAVNAAQPAPAEPVRAGATDRSPVSGPAAAPAGDGGDAAPPAAVDAPAPGGAPVPSGGNSGGGGNETGTGGGSGSAPAAAPEPATASPPTPASPPAPQATAPAPEVTTSVPKPEPAPAPGNSASATAAEHASDRGVEASASSSPTADGGATTAAVAPESAPPGNGNGLAKGHDQ